MILLKSLGLIPRDAEREKVDVPASQLEKIKQELADVAEAMLRSKVRLSGREWAELFAEERRAMIAAGNALHAQFVEDVVRSIMDRHYLAQLTSPHDGGELGTAIRKEEALNGLSSGMDEIRKDFSKHRYVLP